MDFGGKLTPHEPLKKRKNIKNRDLCTNLAQTNPKKPQRNKKIIIKKEKQLRKPPEKTKKKEKISIGFVMYRLYVSWGSSPCGLDLRVQSIYNVLTTADFQHHETLH